MFKNFNGYYNEKLRKLPYTKLSLLIHTYGGLKMLSFIMNYYRVFNVGSTSTRTLTKILS